MAVARLSPAMNLFRRSPLSLDCWMPDHVWPYWTRPWNSGNHGRVASLEPLGAGEDEIEQDGEPLGLGQDRADVAFIGASRGPDIVQSGSAMSHDDHGEHRGQEFIPAPASVP
jgi:hypothetical protein